MAVIGVSVSGRAWWSRCPQPRVWPGKHSASAPAGERISGSIRTRTTHSFELASSAARARRRRGTTGPTTAEMWISRSPWSRCSCRVRCSTSSAGTIVARGSPCSDRICSSACHAASVMCTLVSCRCGTPLPPPRGERFEQFAEALLGRLADGLRAGAWSRLIATVGIRSCGTVADLRGEVARRAETLHCEGELLVELGCSVLCALRAEVLQQHLHPQRRL